MIVAAMAAAGAWNWVILGLVLVGLEMLSPGVFLIWLGIAALLTGALDGLFGLSWQAALLVFAVLSIVSVLIGRLLARGQVDSQAQQPFLNRRGEALVGRSFTLDGAIAGGEGQLRVGDSVWRVVGPDMAAGSTIRVTRIDGATLVVERI